MYINLHVIRKSTKKVSSKGKCFKNERSSKKPQICVIAKKSEKEMKGNIMGNN